MFRIPRPAAAFVGSALLLTVLASVASAHGHVCLQADGTTLDRGGHGKPGATGATGDCRATDLVVFTVGWREEPPFVGMKNGLDLLIERMLPSADGSDGHAHDHGAGGEPTAEPVTGATTLSGQYEFGGRVFPVELRAQFGRAGWYTDDITPTRPGTYTLRITGPLTIEVDGQNQTFELNWTHRVATVDPMGDIMFPEEDPSPSALTERIATLESDLAALQSRVNTISTTKQSPGFDAASLVIVGAAGALLLAWRRKR